MKFVNGELLMTIDSLSEGHSLKNAISSLGRISSKVGWRMKAVSVLSPDQVSWPGNFTEDWRSEFETIGQRTLDKFLRKNHARGKIEPKVLFQPFHSRKNSIQTMIREIDSSKPSAVAVFTHTKKMTSSIPAGFVSSLISKSSAPVFVMNAKSPPIKALKTIAFATDFSQPDEASYQEAIAFALQAKAKLLIIHVLPNLVNETMVAYAGITGGWPGFEKFLDAQEKDVKQKAEAWIETAAAKGVDAKSEILNNSKTIWSGILRSAKRNDVDLLVMTEKTGPWEAAILGSVTRKILETSSYPVLVLPIGKK
jgi:nucleotide-binding universal stress UspA family protein